MAFPHYLSFVAASSSNCFHPLSPSPATYAGVFPSNAICGLTKLYYILLPSASGIFGFPSPVHFYPFSQCTVHAFYPIVVLTLGNAAIFNALCILEYVYVGAVHSRGMCIGGIRHKAASVCSCFSKCDHAILPTSGCVTFIGLWMFKTGIVFWVVKTEIACQQVILLAVAFRVFLLQIAD